MRFTVTRFTVTHFTVTRFTVTRFIVTCLFQASHLPFAPSPLPSLLRPLVPAPSIPPRSHYHLPQSSHPPLYVPPSFPPSPPSSFPFSLPVSLPAALFPSSLISLFPIPPPSPPSLPSLPRPFLRPSPSPSPSPSMRSCLAAASTGRHLQHPLVSCQDERGAASGFGHSWRYNR
ncbi:unnamed protein product [Closterium sp. NIES-65]|nr:unnamed protein product [Closterium sp. NIES-65]